MTTHKAKGASTWRYSNPTGLPTIYIALLTLFQDIGPYCVNLKIKGGGKGGAHGQSEEGARPKVVTFGNL